MKTTTRAIAFCAALIVLANSMIFAQDYEPKYIGGYPTKETAERMFEEYDYQAAVQFYLWGYAYFNNLGMHKACVKLGGDERSFYMFDKRVGPQHQLMTAKPRLFAPLEPILDKAWRWNDIEKVK